MSGEDIVLTALGAVLIVATIVFAAIAHRRHRAEMARLEAAHCELDRRLAEGAGALRAVRAQAQLQTGSWALHRGDELVAYRAQLEAYKARARAQQEAYKARTRAQLGVYRAQLEAYKARARDGAGGA